MHGKYNFTEGGIFETQRKEDKLHAQLEKSGELLKSSTELGFC